MCMALIHMLHYIIRAANKNNRHYQFLTIQIRIYKRHSFTQSERNNKTITNSKRNTKIERCLSHSSTALIILQILFFCEEFHKIRTAGKLIL